MKEHKFATDTVVIRKKRQITLPKWVCDEDEIKEDDKLALTHTPAGEIVLKPLNTPSPEDRILEAIEAIRRELPPDFDWEKAWEEVKEDRKKEHR